MINRIVCYLGILFLTFMQVSFRWPLDSGSITSTFGESRLDHFHDGVDMTSTDGKVYPVKPGTLLFMWDKSLYPLENHPGAGNYRVLEHQGDYLSLYMHLNEGGTVKKIYSEKDVVGTIGNTGHSYAKHLHFSIVNSKNWNSINPFTIMPAYTDIFPPQIVDIAIKIGDKLVILKNNSHVRLTQNYPLLVKLVDSISKNERLGIYQFEAYHNDRLVIKKTFNNIVYTSKGLVIEKKGFAHSFEDDYYKVPGIAYAQGLNTIKIIASDFSGNTTEKLFSLDIMLAQQK